MATMINFTRRLVVLAMLYLVGCSSPLTPEEEPSLTNLDGTEWLFSKKVSEFELFTVHIVFEAEVCHVATKLQLGPLPAQTTNQQTLSYTFDGPEVWLLPKDAAQAVGVFHDDYTRLELVDQQAHYFFERVK